MKNCVMGLTNGIEAIEAKRTMCIKWAEEVTAKE